MQLIQNFTDGIYDLKVGGLVIPTYIVTLTNLPMFQNLPDGFAVIFHIQPIPNLFSVAINGQGFPSRAFKIMSGISFSGNWYGP